MILVVAALIFKDEKILIARRSTGDFSVLGKWEFPGGKVEQNEDEKHAIEREIKEEFELEIKAKEFLFNNICEYPSKTVDLRLYSCEDMGNLTYDSIIEKVIFNNEINLIDINTANKELSTVLLDLDKENNLEGQGLIEISVPKFVRTSSNKVTKTTLKKVDHIEKTKKDAQIGLKGEQIVLKSKQEKMFKNGKPELIESINWVSRYDDSKGYDIESYEFDEEGNAYRIYIEVKTAECNERTNFFVTKNEITVMNEHKEKYWIYRVFNVNKKPKFYRLNGIDFHKKFKLDEYIYIAQLK